MARPFLLQTRWLVGHFIIVVMATVMVVLGFWQHDRLQDRRDRNHETRLALSAPPSTELPAPSTREWTHVRLTGTWQPEHSRLVRYPLHNGQPGYHLVTPFVTSSGVIIVNRGWLPVELGKNLALPAVTSVRGTVSIDGWYRHADALRGAPGVNDSRQSPVTTITAIDEPWVQLTKGEDPLNPQRLDGPDLSDGPHFSYMLQWWSFALIAIIGWVTLLWRAHRDVS